MKVKKKLIEVRKHTKESQMKKGFNYISPILSAVVAVSLIIGQGSGYLSQKLMLENNIRERVQDALSKLIDSHKYVINVDVELEIIDEVNEQITVFAPRESSKPKSSPIKPSPAEETASALIQMQEAMMEDEPSTDQSSYSIGLPIPGFEVDMTEQQQTKKEKPLPKVVPISPTTMDPIESIGNDSDNEPAKDVVDKVLSRKRPSRAEIKRLDMTLILQEGAAPELIENIRQLTMAASKFDRDRGDKLTIMSASFKERRDARSAEQIMLKNIAEKIDLLEQKRVAENTDWRDQIDQYRQEESARREEDKSFFQTQLAQMEEKAKAQAYAQEKKEMLRRDSLKVATLNNEIQALKDMLEISAKDDAEKQAKTDSSRFALLDNELQGLRKVLLQAILQDSIDGQKKAQAQIQAELAEREKEKAKRDSLIEEKIAELDAVQGELDQLQNEMSSGLDTTKIMMIALGVIAALLLFALVFVMSRSRQQAPPMPPWMYPPPRPQRRKKKSGKKDRGSKKEEQPEEEPTPVEVSPSPKEPIVQKTSPSEDLNVIRSEIDDIRKSVVSMSVGQPEKTSTIVKEWLEQPAPTPSEPASTEEESSGDENDEGGDE
tara:strand:+ start:3172 stop:4986 length:1815 start_codon:yes stop_codon:yes gene_type:complete